MSKAEIVSIIVTLISMIVLTVGFTLFFAYFSKKEKKAIDEGERDIEIIDEAIEKKAHAKRKKAFKIAGNCLYALALIIMIPTLVYALFARFSSNGMLFDSSLMVVASGSMSQKNAENGYLIENDLNNQFDTYDVIIIHKVKDKSELALYDIVAYSNKTLDETIIHRIIGYDDYGNYLTRGDSNNATDTYHPSFEDIIGKYDNHRIRKVGAFVLFLQSYSGIITIAALVYSLFMSEHYSAKMKEDKETREKKLLSYISLGEEAPPQYDEEIRYQGYLYRFKESGFVSKEESAWLSSPSYLERAIRIGDRESRRVFDLAKGEEIYGK